MAAEKKKGVKKKKRKKSHHTHRWRPDPTQMSKGAARQPEHLRKERRTVAEHGGFADGYMSREMMESPSQMSQYHLISGDKTICVRKAAVHPHLFRFCLFFLPLLFLYFQR